ncbi:hypothetical protein [Deinococcus enclensis]|uniref:Uncharacterized protein n=1 Tax=Deinococcus enclensis TaxID=1049582 RepID=A0ABT9MJA0_9DEIO|nr:hypothetical protein [Deinococcus enclensis]MDP9766647.1 hypothetical protein [Deinococcus enclensis]
MTEPSHPVAPPAAHRAWVWLLPLALTSTAVTVYLALSSVSVIVLLLFAGGVPAEENLQPTPVEPLLLTTAVVWVGVLLAALLPRNRAGVVLAILGGIGAALVTLTSGVTVVLWLALVCAFPALQARPRPTA